MNDQDLAAFLDRPLTAVAGTIGRDGSPHAVPLWYRYDGGRFTIWTGESRAWVRNLQRDPRISLTIAEHDRPFAAVLVRGTATVTTSGAALDEARRICARYIEASALDGYVEGFSDLQTIVEVTPDRVASWGRGY
ncbi:MAG: TIGR03618 family F420-dependent PPOX class oxidoreductase [Dehalococcoidia bacterium]|nr:TIGR03618 family F420-dependent PPOX class oxidoreductase [Dehalococcoidia bacterium]